MDVSALFAAPTVSVTSTTQPVALLPGFARIRTATDDHFDPGHAVIALVIFGVSLLAYKQLITKAKR